MSWLIKCLDEVDLQGYSKCLGSCKDFTSSKGGVTSWCVQKWQEAGGVIIGKLNMHELGLGMKQEPSKSFISSRCKRTTFADGIDTTNNNPAKGTPLNPHNSHYYTGGSSGGSAYTVAAGLCTLCLLLNFPLIESDIES